MAERGRREGQQLGNYRLTRLLGKGGFAEVYLGEHIYLKSRAALKVLHTQLSEQNAANFLQEAQTLANLSHPHIVRVLDMAVQDGTPFLVMEYAPHGTLRHHHAIRNAFTTGDGCSLCPAGRRRLAICSRPATHPP
jgi:eukaryotic-like serine/threonine-protein kinase